MEQVNSFLNSNKLSVALSVVGIVLVISGILASKSYQKPQSYPKESLVKTTNSQIKIDISGAVTAPGVYELPENSRVDDAIKSAGGVLASASAGYVSKKLNLSQKLQDGLKIYIPFEGETSVIAPNLPNSPNFPNPQSLVGINSASAGELEALPGVGPATASKIISNRPYSSLEELVSKKSVSRTVFEKIKDKTDLN